MVFPFPLHFTPLHPTLYTRLGAHPSFLLLSPSTAIHLPHATTLPPSDNTQTRSRRLWGLGLARSSLASMQPHKLVHSLETVLQGFLDRLK